MIQESFHFYDRDMQYGVHDSDYTIPLATSVEDVKKSFEISVRNKKIIKL